MGYYTYYELRMWDESGEIINKDHYLYSKIKTRFAEIFGDSDYSNDLFDYMITDGDELKWYEHSHDMEELAKSFPDVMFELEGTGEEREDWWIAQYYKGKISESFAEVIPPLPTLF